MAKELKNAVEQMEKTRVETDPLRALREWRMAATKRFTGKSLAIATKPAKGRSK